jgi:predicted membrane protein DUF2306
LKQLHSNYVRLIGNPASGRNSGSSLAGDNLSSIQNFRSTKLQRVLTLLAALLILKVTVAIVLKYRDYFPRNFNSDFLHGREQYFSGGYQWAFYVHIASGPISLMLGLILISERFRRRFPKWHRLLGRAQVVAVLFLVTPSGLWMAYHAEAGPISSIGFALLAVVTGTCVAMGWRSAVKRRFFEHRRWMFRCFLLLCAAVVIRIIGELATVAGAQVEWIYPLAAWVSWLVPLAAFELASRERNRSVRSSFIRRALTTPER